MTGTVIFIILLIAGFAYMVKSTAPKLPHHCEECGRDLNHEPMGLNIGCESCTCGKVTKGF